MAESVASPSCIKLHMQRSYGRERRCLSQKSSFSMRESCRRHTRGSCKAIQLSMQKISKTNIAGVRNLKVHPLTRESSFTCNCLGFLVDPEGTTSSGLVPVGDQILLMTSIFLTYMAGVIPVQKSNFTSQMNVVNNDVTPESPTSPGRQEGDNANLNCAWEVVKDKLLDSLNAIEHGGNMDYVVPEIKTDQEKHPLSLYAVSDGPKFRLLWASFQQLEKQVNNISSNSDTLERDDWLAVFSQIIKDFCQPVSMAWLLKELCLANSNPDQKIISLIIEKLKGEDTVLHNIIKSGKKDLYAELVYHLRFGFLRKGCCYDHSLFTLHADSVLEDLVVTLADGIAGNFLELISIDGTLSDEISSLGLVMCKLSTRSLQKLRNEVTLNQWLYQNVKAVVSMYEDRFDLRTFQSQYTEESSRDSQTRNQSWWKKLGIRKSKTVLSALRYIVITQVSISVKRTKELRALTGWRYYFSLFLELSDISMPLVKSVSRKISDAISFFLVCLIGRSLGLIYTGIRQSLRWK